MTIFTQHSVGTVSSGENALIIKPKYPPVVAQRGVMFVHGAGSTATYCIDTYGRQSSLTGAIANAGFTCFSGDIGGTSTWGNSTAMARMTTAYNYLQTQPGVKPGKVALISGSMGGLTSLNWAAANPTLVSAVVSVIPVINPNDIVVNNRGGYAASINAAYGGAWSEATSGATNNPRTMATNSAKLQGIPMLFFYGTTDTLCMPAQVEGFAASAGMNVTLVPLATGHEEASYTAVDHPRVTAFLKTNSA